MPSDPKRRPHPSHYQTTGRQSLSDVACDVYGVKRIEARDVMLHLRRRNSLLRPFLSDLERPLPANLLLALPRPHEIRSPGPSIISDAQNVLVRIRQSVYEIEELRGAGIAIEFPNNDPVVLQPPSTEDVLQTWVILVVKIDKAAPSQELPFFQKYKGTLVSCGAFGFGYVATAASCGETPFTAGAATPLCVASWIGTSATAGQCVLSIAKDQSEDFAEYVQTADGEWINYVDISLDLISLGIGVGSLPGALKSGHSALQASKYAKVLSSVPKGKLIETMTRIEKLTNEFAALKALLEVGLKNTNPAGKQILTNNIIKRMLPRVSTVLRRQKLIALSASTAASLSLLSSSYGGVGSSGWSVVVLIRQFAGDWANGK